jgi:glycerate dehydrogenase
MNVAFLDFATLGPDDLDTSELRTLLPELKIYAATRPDELVTRIADAEILLLNKVRLDAAAFSAAPNLKLICLAATGTDNIDLESAREHGVTVCNIRDYCTGSVVQHVFALILTLNQQLNAYRELLAAGAWQESEQFCLHHLPIGELTNKTLGIIGLGTLGSAVARVATAFGMRVVAAQMPWSTNPAEALENNPGISRLPLPELFRSADVVTLHCPLNDHTKHLINAEALELMPESSLLINTARGGLVDSAALIAALKSHQIGGAGIDVLSQEPPTDNDPLLAESLPNLVVTPHIAWAARESRQQALNDVVSNVGAFLAGTPQNQMN